MRQMRRIALQPLCAKPHFPALTGALLLAALPATAHSQFTDLGTLNGGTQTYAFGVSGNGSVVVGYALDGAASDYRAFRWTQATGLVSLGSLNGGHSSSAYAVSSDGNVVVGLASDGAAGNADRAFRWTQTGGMVSLGTLNGGNSSNAHAVNSDGSVVVGDAVNGVTVTTQAFRWTH